MCRHLAVASALLASLAGICSQPLLLTALLEAGDIYRARNLSRVQPLFTGDHTESYAAFLTVDNTYNSTLFFWYFPAEDDEGSAPVILWLQGGPGVSSMLGLFVEHGPYLINDDYTIHKRNIYWSRNHHVIYLDNPVGTGFSYADDENGYSRNESDIGNNIYKVLLQFFTLFPHISNNSFFLAGESYGGKYAIAGAHVIHSHNSEAELKINLQGVMIGNGFVDPVNMMSYGNFLTQLGIIDDIQLAHFHAQESLIKEHVRHERWIQAYKTWQTLLGSGHQSYLYNETGYSYLLNLLYDDKEPDIDDSYISVVRSSAVRNAINVGDKTFHSPLSVASKLEGDMFQSMKPWLEQLLERYRVLVYNGQLDIICAHALVASYLRQLQWSGSVAFQEARTHSWHVQGQLAGYVKSGGRLTELLVRRAGHMVPANQPQWALNMVTMFTYNTTLV